MSAPQLSNTALAKAWVSALLFEIRAQVSVNRPQITAWHHRTCLRTPGTPGLSSQECSDHSGRARPPRLHSEDEGQRITTGSSWMRPLYIVFVYVLAAVHALWQSFRVPVAINSNKPLCAHVAIIT